MEEDEAKVKSPEKNDNGTLVVSSLDDLMRLKRLPQVFDLNCCEEFSIENKEITAGNGLSGVVCSIKHLAQGRRAKMEGFLRLVVCNADLGPERGGQNDLIEYDKGDCGNAPSISFRCLGRLLAGNVHGKELRVDYGSEALVEGKVVILDFEPDQRLPLKAGKKVGGKWVPPSAGFTKIGPTWHRPAIVLLREKNKHFLMGQDDSQYFGVQLKGRPFTVADAFADLIPEEARVGGVERQGEWFMVPVDEKNIPEPFGEIDGYVILPRERMSNEHKLSGAELRIRDNVIFARSPTLEHDEHGALHGSGWFKFIKNTAVLSVSVEGVD